MSRQKRPPIPQKIKNLVLERADNKCEKCGHILEKGHYHYHHISYVRLGEESPDDLLILCVCCHSLEHPKHKIEPENIRKAKRTAKLKRRAKNKKKYENASKRHKAKKRYGGEICEVEKGNQARKRDRKKLTKIYKSNEY